MTPRDAAAAAPRQPPRAGGLYGTVLMLAVITALTKSGKAEPWVVLGGVVVTAIVFWVVHVYADTLAARVAEPTRPWRAIIGETAREEIAIIEAVLPPAIPLLLGTVGLLSREAASWTAIAFGLVELFGWGLLVARALGHRGLHALALGLFNIALGGVMVGLKVLVH
jgi:hypothetical protein